MRGKLFGYLALREACGITPAHAGKTRENALALYDGGDHPRACGENRFLSQLVADHGGSPPRMRGKPIKGAVAAYATGITPRACGENGYPIEIVETPVGSPPRMRGKHFDYYPAHDLFGITPAHAGKTFCGDFSVAFSRDHPRACGENRPSRVSRSRSRGSPPRMRGKLVIEVGKVVWDGITPAHAGKTKAIL